MGHTIDIDTGGTFTDGVFVFGDRAASVQVPTTPHDLIVCFLNFHGAGYKPSPLGGIVFSEQFL